MRTRARISGHIQGGLMWEVYPDSCPRAAYFHSGGQQVDPQLWAGPRELGENAACICSMIVGVCGWRNHIILQRGVPCEQGESGGLEVGHWKEGTKEANAAGALHRSPVGE